MAYGWDDDVDTATLAAALALGDLTAASVEAVNVSALADEHPSAALADPALNRRSWRAWSAAARRAVSPTFCGQAPLTELRIAQHPGLESNDPAHIDELAQNPWSTALGTLHPYLPADRAQMTAQELLTMAMWSVWWWRAWLPIVERATIRDGYSSFEAGTFAFGLCARLVTVPGGLELAGGLADDWVQPWDQLEVAVRALAATDRSSRPPGQPDRAR